MRKAFYLVMTLVFLGACDTASNVKQPNKDYFLKYFGGDGNQTAVDLVVNGGIFFVLGNSRKTTDSIQRIYLAKANAFGELIGNEVLYGDSETEARDFLLTKDGNYLVVVANQGPNALLIRFTTNAPTASGIAKNANDAVVIPGMYANSVTELSDGGFIAEGYQVQGSGQKAEYHFRWNGNPWSAYAPAAVWHPNFNGNGSGSDFIGIRTIQHDAISFYTFGSINAQYKAPPGNTNFKFMAYQLGEFGDASGGGTGDNGTFAAQGYNTNNYLTCAVEAGIGGFLVAGVARSPLTDSLKVAITLDPNFNVTPGDVFKDLLIEDLGKAGQSGHPFATAYSATLHNFVLANKYNAASPPTSDIILLKVNNALEPQWGGGPIPHYVQFGGDGDDTAAAVAELPDGHIMVLGTMQLGNPPTQFKIVLMKLNANGKLAE